MSLQDDSFLQGHRISYWDVRCLTALVEAQLWQELPSPTASLVSCLECWLYSIRWGFLGSLLLQFLGRDSNSEGFGGIISKVYFSMHVCVRTWVCNTCTCAQESETLLQTLPFLSFVWRSALTLASSSRTWYQVSCSQSSRAAFEVHFYLWVVSSRRVRCGYVSVFHVKFVDLLEYVA